MRITAQLIEVGTGAHLWADRFDGSLEDVFDLQDQVATSVAGVIEPTLQAAEIRRSIAHPTADLSAYDLYLRALHHIPTHSRDGTALALDLLRQAIARDPDSCDGRASPCDMQTSGCTDDPEATRRDGIDLARRALRAAGGDASVLGRAAYYLAKTSIRPSR